MCIMRRHGIAEPKLSEHYGNTFDMLGLAYMFNDGAYEHSESDPETFHDSEDDSDDVFFGMW